MTIYERQQARKAAEHWYGPWDKTREAIREAKGADECSDVAWEQLQRTQAITQAVLLAQAPDNTRGMANAPSDALAVPLVPPGAWLSRLFFGEPIDYNEDRLP